MDAIATETIEQNGQTYRLAIYTDPDVPNPLEDWCDPAIHAAAIKAARDCVWIIQAVLREEEVIEATREFYRVIRERMEALKAKGTACQHRR